MKRKAILHMMTMNVFILFIIWFFTITKTEIYNNKNHRWELWQGLSCKLILLCSVGLGLFRLKLLHVLNSNQKHIAMLECRWKKYDPHFNCYKKSFHTHHNSTEKKACVRHFGSNCSFYRFKDVYRLDYRSYHSYIRLCIDEHGWRKLTSGRASRWEMRGWKTGQDRRKTFRPTLIHNILISVARKAHIATTTDITLQAWWMETDVS